MGGQNEIVVPALWTDMEVCSYTHIFLKKVCEKFAQKN